MVRTCLFNWAYARHTGGTFVFRIEDTDAARDSEESFDAILDSLTWLGLDWDEGVGKGGPHEPYRQSQRMDLYKQVAAELLEAGYLYESFSTPEEIEARHRERGEDPKLGYDGFDRDLTQEQKDAFRADAGLLEGVELVGSGDLTARLWTKPTLTVIGMDVTPLELAGNVLAPACTARLSMRIAPGQDPQAALEALRSHLEAHAPFGARLTVAQGEVGPAFDGSSDSPAGRAAHWALTTAFGQDCVDIGQGGSIPFISTLQETFPDAQVLVTGIEDPDTRAHSEDESMHLGDLERIVIGEALLLARLGGAIDGPQDAESAGAQR